MSCRIRPEPFREASSAGFSLIEVLVAMLIVSVGVLGVAGLQLISLQNNSSVVLRTQASLASSEIIDRARANLDENYEFPMANAAPAQPDCVGNDCNAAQMRDYDIAIWLRDIGTALPSGDASIEIDDIPPPPAPTLRKKIRVTVQWQEGRAQGAPMNTLVTEGVM